MNLLQIVRKRWNPTKNARMQQNSQIFKKFHTPFRTSVLHATEETSKFVSIYLKSHKL